MSVRLSCPYCNAAVALETVPPSRRATCPRCGENFPVKAPSADDPDPHLPGMSANGPPEPPPPPATESPARAFRAPALIGSALGAAVLAIGLYAALAPSRGDRTQPTDAGPTRTAATVPPAAVSGLGYLPADTNVAFAVQPTAVVLSAERTNTDPRRLLAQAGVPDQFFAALDRVGVKLDQIDQLCGGLVVPPDNPIPRAVVVLALKGEPADRAAFLKALKAEKPSSVGGQTRYSVDLGLVLPFTLVSPDPRTFVFATAEKDLDGVGSAKGRGSGHLSAGLRESMGQLSPASAAWAATAPDRWGEKPLATVAAAALKVPDLPKRLAGVRAVAVGVSLEPDPKLTAAVRTADAPAAQKLQDSAAAALAGRDPPVQIGGRGEWVAVESPLGAEQGVAVLQALLPKK